MDLPGQVQAFNVAGISLKIGVIPGILEENMETTIVCRGYMGDAGREDGNYFFDFLQEATTSPEGSTQQQWTVQAGWIRSTVSTLADGEDFEEHLHLQVAHATRRRNIQKTVAMGCDMYHHLVWLPHLYCDHFSSCYTGLQGHAGWPGHHVMVERHWP